MKVTLPYNFEDGFLRIALSRIQQAFEELNPYAQVPGGGDAGQVLVRDTAQPYSMRWSTIMRAGTVALASGTASVTLSPAEADANYQILLSCDANETLRWSSKATGGFTITSSNGASTANVDWAVIRPAT